VPRTVHGRLGRHRPSTPGRKLTAGTRRAVAIQSSSTPGNSTSGSRANGHGIFTGRSAYDVFYAYADRDAAEGQSAGRSDSAQQPADSHTAEVARTRLRAGPDNPDPAAATTSHESADQRGIGTGTRGSEPL